MGNVALFPLQNPTYNFYLNLIIGGVRSKEATTHTYIHIYVYIQW